MGQLTTTWRVTPHASVIADTGLRRVEIADPSGSFRVAMQASEAVRLAHELLIASADAGERDLAVQRLGDIVDDLTEGC